MTTFKNAWDLKVVLPDAELIRIDDAGHAGGEPGIADAMIRCTEKYKNLF